MRDKIIPAIGIVVVTIVLIVINELTDTNFIQDYALIFIIAAMLLGVWLAKISGKQRGKK